MKLARARVIEGLNQPAPELQGASRGNPQQLFQTLVHFKNRLDSLETASGGANINLAKPAKNAAPPPFAGLDVSALKNSGNLVIRLTNPQFKVSEGNTTGTPIYHHIEVSHDPQFRTGVTKLPVTGQTYLELKRPTGLKNYVKLQSSVDGKTKNSPQFSGPVAA